MAKKTVKTLSTAELIQSKEKELTQLNEQLAETKARLKTAESELAQLNEQQKIEKLSDIGSIAEKAGLSVDDLVSAFKDGTILSLIEKKDNKSEVPVTNNAVATPVKPATSPVNAPSWNNNNGNT